MRHPQKDQYAEIYREQSKYAEILKRQERERSEKNRREREDADYKKKLSSLQKKLDVSTPPPPKIFISGCFPRGGLSLIIAAPGTGKTWFTLRIACDLSVGGSVFEGFAEETKPLKSLIFAGEAGSDLLLQRAYDTHWDFNKENITVIDLIKAESNDISLMLDTEAGKKNIDTFISENKPDIVFFDTLGSFHSRNESRANQIKSITQFLMRLAQKYNIAVVATHHTRKVPARAKKNPLTQNDSLGSVAITGDPNVVIALESFSREDLSDKSVQMQSILDAEERADNKVVLVKSVKSWYKEFLPFTFAINNDEVGTHMYVDLMPSFSQEKKDTLKDLLLHHLRGKYAVNEWFKSSDIPNNFSGEIVSTRHILRLLMTLVDEGEIIKKGFGRNRVYANVSLENKQLQDFTGITDKLTK